MRRLMLLYASLSALAFFVLATPALAQGRTWVSSSGTNSGSCTQAAPCATFQYAISQTGASGEVDCLSSGDFGPITITFSITIDCGEGNIGRVEPSTVTGTAIEIDTSSASTIILRHLSLNQVATSIADCCNGIYASSFPSGTLIIEHCLIIGFGELAPGGYGIYFGPSSGRGILQVSDTAVYNNRQGIVIDASASNVIASAVLDGVKLNANTYGLLLQGPGIVAGTLRHSVVAENNTTGVYASAGQVFFTVEESSVIDNLSYGIQADSSAANLEVGASTFGGNGTGVFAQKGAVYTFGNNQMSANATNGTFTGTTPLE